MHTLRVLGVVFTALLPSLAVAADGPGAVLRRYLDARWRGDLAAAEALWDAGDLRRSQALGTQYTGLEARYDDNLLWTPAARAAAASRRFTVLDSTLAADNGTFGVVVHGSAGADTLRWGVRAASGEWRVTSAFDVVTRPWTVREGRFVRVRASRLRHLNADAMTALDSEFESMLQRLGATEQARMRVERLKVEYALCASAADVRAICGSRAAGYRLAGERIVTRSNSDLASLGMVAVHLAAKELPPYAVTWLEEGTAAALGGAEHASAAVVLAQGAARIGSGDRDAEAVLDPARYAALPKASRTPLAATWSAGLLRTLGPARFVELYRDLSMADPARAMDAALLRKQIETATGKRGAALGEWLKTSAAATPLPLVPGYGAQMPQETRSVRPMVRWRDMSERWALEAYEVGDDYVFVVQPYAGATPAWAQRLADSLATARGETPAARTAPSRPPGDPPQLALLFKRRLHDEPEAYESAVFQEHFRQRSYAGELFAIFIGVDAVRVWDYRRDTLTAVVSPEMTPAASKQLYDKEPGRIAFRLRRDLFAAPLVEYVATNLVYTGE